MARFEDVLAALPDFRNALHTQTHEEAASPGIMAAFVERGNVPAFSTPLRNVHATAVGVRVRNGKVIDDEFVLKVFVFNKLDLGEQTPMIMREYGGIGVDVEPLPVQVAAPALQPGEGRTASASKASAAVSPPRGPVRPIIGGVSTAPISRSYAGTLGSFVQRRDESGATTFALSNNHVFADVNTLPAGTIMIQPAARDGSPNEEYAKLTAYTPIQFPPPAAVTNRFDAAIAAVTDITKVKLGTINGIARYTPVIGTPVPGMRVTKSGRTTGVTSGKIVAIRTNPIQVDYGVPGSPRIASFIDTIEIIGDSGSFSMPGDSGSVILDTESGRPVALLFAGDGVHTTACDFGGVCRALNVVPV